MESNCIFQHSDGNDEEVFVEVFGSLIESHYAYLVKAVGGREINGRDQVHDG